MDTGQIEQRLAWLEDQQRKLGQQAGKLAEGLGEAQTALAKVARQGQELSADVARMSAVAQRLQQFEETMHKHRQEVARLLGEAEDRRSGKEKLLQQMHQSELEETNRAVAEMRMDLGLLGQVQQSLDARREEEQRIARSQDAMRKQLEALQARDGERAEALASLQSEVRQEARQTADSLAGWVAYRGRVDALGEMSEKLGEQLRRAETRLAELLASEGERQQTLGVWLEQQGLRQAELDRAWRDWQRRFQEFEKRAGELDERILAYEGTHRGLRALRDELAQLIERTERRINEITEIQRLAEERIKHEWTSFLADDAKRWNSHKLTWDEQWRDHARGHDKLTGQVAGHDERLNGAEDRLSTLETEGRSRLAELLALVRGWASEGERGSGEARRRR
jgi:chromosome segregation ATPase